MSKISDTMNTITDFSNNGDPHWCASNREICPKSEKLGISNVKIEYDFSEMPIIKETNEKKHGEEVVDHPSHYNHGKYECIDVIDDLKLNFNLGQHSSTFGEWDSKMMKSLNSRKLFGIFSVKLKIGREQRMKTKTCKKADNMCEYDNSLDNKFKANICLGKDVIVTEELIVNENELDHIDHMTYDDIDTAFFNIINEKYPSDSFPNADIKNIEVFSDGEWFPVFSESMTNEIDECKKSKKYNKFLILPDATYHLTKEAKLWMKLKEQSIIPEDSEFDFEKMHEIIQSLS